MLCLQVCHLCFLGTKIQPVSLLVLLTRQLIARIEHCHGLSRFQVELKHIDLVLVPSLQFRFRYRQISAEATFVEQTQAQTDDTEASSHTSDHIQVLSGDLQVFASPADEE